jgi:hypothetical protein
MSLSLARGAMAPAQARASSHHHRCLQAYEDLPPGATPVWCRVHHQQGVTQWLTQHFTTAEAINTRTPVMKHVFQTQDKRTVQRRLARLKT